MSYKQTRADFEYLETIIELEDTVEQMSDLTDFMRNPTKKFAQELYEAMISGWFGEQYTTHSRFLGSTEFKPDKRTKRIADRYRIDLDYLDD